VIRQDIDETRESLAKKVETLEEQVKDTITNVKDTVEDTIESVKERVQDTVQGVTASVEDTVSAVKQTFDLSHQVERHPWAMAGCSLAAGLATGYLLTGRREPRYDYSYGSRGGYEPARSDMQAGYSPRAASSYAAAPAPAAPAAPAEPQGPGLLTRLLTPFESEIDKVKEVAIGALLGMLRDTIKRSLPPNLAANVDDIMNSATRKAGGKPVDGPVLSEEGGRPGGYR